MHDRFKFRVWDSSANAYVPRSQFILLSDGTLIQEIGGEEVIWELTEPEFCTGLKDKNGKLIYEGDIVRVIEQCMTNTLDRSYPMLFNEKTAKFGFKHPDGHFFYFTNDDDFSYEIIGNIHENADLLGEK